MPHLRRLLPTLGVALVLLAVAAPAGAADRVPTTGRGGILVVQVQGLLDPPNARLITDAVRDANRARGSLVILNLDSAGAVDVDTRAVVRVIRASRVPVTVWIGPAGAEARGAAAVVAAASSAAASSSRLCVGATRSFAPRSRLSSPSGLRIGRNHFAPIGSTCFPISTSIRWVTTQSTLVRSSARMLPYSKRNSPMVVITSPVARLV